MLKFKLMLFLAAFGFSSSSMASFYFESGINHDFDPRWFWLSDERIDSENRINQQSLFTRFEFGKSYNWTKIKNIPVSLKGYITHDSNPFETGREELRDMTAIGIKSCLNCANPGGYLEAGLNYDPNPIVAELNGGQITQGKFFTRIETGGKFKWAEFSQKKRPLFFKMGLSYDKTLTGSADLRDMLALNIKLCIGSC